jgi:hypothetical protein
VSLFDRFRATTSTEQTGYEAAEIDAELAEALTSPGDRDAVTVRPNKDNGGIEAMADVLESLHSIETESGFLQGDATNISPAHTYEMRYAQARDAGDRVVSLQYVAGDDRTDGTLERQLQTQYPDSQLDRTTSELIPETGVEGRYVAGATLELRRYTLYPIKNVDLPGFNTDPTGSILEEMVGTQDDAETDADVVVQIQFKPALRDWTDGVENGHGVADADDKSVRGSPSIKTLAKNLRQPTYEKEWRLYTRETVEYPPSKVDKNVATLLEEQQGSKGWRLCLRVFAISDDPETAVERASHTAGMFRNFYENNAEQTFRPNPLSQSDVREVAMRAARREWRDTGIVKAQREVAGLLNVPKAEYVTTNKMRWALASPGEGIPPGTPRFAFDAHGVVDATAAEKQVAMLDESEAGDPYWYGFGGRHGVEAGVDPDVLNVHQFVGGGTGKGKTTWLVNLASQIMNRGHGALIFDPKGKDADEFVREWPDDRPEEDFVFVDLSDDYDHQVRFNFLEVPGDVEPGTRKFASTVEALCDDLTAMISQAGGDDNYWGALMNRVARTLIRGMAKSGRTCTLLDLACACTSAANRERFAEWMSEERLHFIEDAAERIKEKEDSDLEPLAGRLDQWIQNDAIRDLVAARESTVSVSEAVREGKVVVVRNAPSSGETEKRLFATALIRRAWVAARENADSPPFYVICDEFDSIVSEESDIHRILSEARAFEFCLTLACQNPSNQLPEKVQKAVENQCETFISFNPGGKDDAKLISAQHSPEVEWEDLTNLSKYRFYMRTHDDADELTHSYKVDAFPPIGETRADVTGQPGMTDAELEALKRRSVERYGDRIKSAEEQKAESHFYDVGSENAAVDLTESRERAILKAALDESIHRDAVDAGEFVPAEAVGQRAREYLDVDLQGLGKLWDLVDHVPDDLLKRTDVDGETHLRCTERGRTRVFATGGDENAGGVNHRELLKDAYVPLTRAGLMVDLPTQEADGLPDGRAEPEALRTVDTGALSVAEVASVFDTFRADHSALAHLTDGERVSLEAEHETSTKPGQTVRNLEKAVDRGERCLFLVRDDVADRVHNTLSSPPYVREQGDGKTTFYNRRNLYIDGEQVFRPDNGARSTVWRREESAGTYVLADSDGNEHARFASLDSLYNDADAYPATESDVDDADEWRPVKDPVVPERVFDGATPGSEAWDVVVVGSDATEPADLAVIDGGDRVPLLEVESTEPDRTGAHLDGDESTDDLDVPDGPAALLELLRETNGHVTTSEAHALATESGVDDLDVSRRSIGNYLDALADAGALDVDRTGRANEYRLVD